MNFKKCDRCGESLTNEFPVANITSINRLLIESNNLLDFRHKDFDLCGKCTKEFEKFMEAK